jgi:hypothetical protein
MASQQSKSAAVVSKTKALICFQFAMISSLSSDNDESSLGWSECPAAMWCVHAAAPCTCSVASACGPRAASLSDALTMLMIRGLVANLFGSW